MINKIKVLTITSPFYDPAANRIQRQLSKFGALAELEEGVHVIKNKQGNLASYRQELEDGYIKKWFIALNGDEVTITHNKGKRQTRNLSLEYQSID